MLVEQEEEKKNDSRRKNKESPPRAAEYFKVSVTFSVKGKRDAQELHFTPEALRASWYAASCGVFTQGRIKITTHQAQRIKNCSIQNKPTAAQQGAAPDRLPPVCFLRLEGFRAASGG